MEVNLIFLIDKTELIFCYYYSSLTSKMPQRYLHYFGTESSKSILQIKGVIKENDDIQI
jgi:hypothetical protein